VDASHFNVDELLLRLLFAAQGGICLHAPKYHLLGADLRKPPFETLNTLISPESGALLDPSLPTLLLCECVLVYMTLNESSAILQWFREYFKESVLGCVVYEMFGLDDAFGRVMVNNLRVCRFFFFKTRLLSPSDL